MKRLFLITLLVLSVFVSCFVTAHASNIGDVVGKTLYTDIVAKINNYDIAAFNYNGYTMVVAEDLRNYGFDVEWNPYDRTLSVKRNPSVTTVASTYLTPQIPASLAGKKSFDVLYTDIRTFVDGNEVMSYNIDGATIINLEELKVYGDVLFNEFTRTLEININDGLAVNIAQYDESYYYDRIISMKLSYPEGMPWTNYNYYVWNADIHHTGYGCAGFSYILSDAAFGHVPARIIDENITIDMLRVGDILRINNNTHSVVVLEVHSDHIIVAEGNYNSSIHWGRRLSKRAVESATYLQTRYVQ